MERCGIPAIERVREPLLYHFTESVMNSCDRLTSRRSHEWCLTLVVAAFTMFAAVSLEAQRRIVDFGDVRVGTGAVKPVASLTNSYNEVITYTGTIEGSTQFFFDPPSQQVGPGGLGFMFVVFRPTREGRDSAIARLGSNPTAYETFVVVGRGVAASAVSARLVSGGVNLRHVEGAGEMIAELNQQRAGRVRISLWSLDGRLALQPIDEIVGAGMHRFRIDMGSLASGPYICRIESSEDASTTIVRR